MLTIVGHTMTVSWLMNVPYVCICTFGHEPEFLPQFVECVRGCVGVQVRVLTARLVHTTDLHYLLGCPRQRTQCWTQFWAQRGTGQAAGWHLRHSWCGLARKDRPWPRRRKTERYVYRWQDGCTEGWMDGVVMIWGHKDILQKQTECGSARKRPEEM